MHSRRPVHRCLPWALAILVAPSTATACPQGSKPIFACDTTTRRHVEVCDSGRTIHYAYGRPGARPELAFSVPRQAATTWQWPGVGRYMSYAVDVPNGDTVYSMYWGMDRMTEMHEVDAGIAISVDGKDVATVHCTPGSARQALESIDLRPSN
jgi:hypothetical protein